jgi:DNA-binding CsgD family transcriptional regulator
MRLPKRRGDQKPVDLPTISVLVAPSGQIVGARTHHFSEDATTSKLKGQNYAEQCSPIYRPAIRELLTRDRQLLSAIMPPPTLNTDAWFAVVGVPLGAAKAGGALFVHMDVSPWVSASGDAIGVPSEISMDLLQSAMATAFIGDIKGTSEEEKKRDLYDGIDSLTKRQAEVLKLIGTGKSNIEIADELSCSLNTVKRHVTAVLQKLKLPNRTRAAMLVNKIGGKSGAAD